MPALPPLPAGLPGSLWRPLSDADADVFAVLLEASRVADRGEEVMTAEIARRELEDPACPPATNTLGLALGDGTLGALALVHERLSAADARRAFLSGTVRPDLRGRGIGTSLVAWGAARADEVLAGQPADVLRVAEAFLDDRMAGAIGLYEAAGFERARWYMEMRRDLALPIAADRPPAGIRLEPYREELAERLREAHNEAFADHWGSSPLSEDVWRREFVGDPRFRPDLTVAAFDGAEIAGYSLNYVAADDWEATGIREGWVGQLGVRRPWRRRGLATSLLGRSMSAFREAGLDGAILGVDADNPTGAVGLYERLGFRPVSRTVRLQRALRAGTGSEG